MDENCIYYFLRTDRGFVYMIEVPIGGTVSVVGKSGTLLTKAAIYVRELAGWQFSTCQRHETMIGRGSVLTLRAPSRAYEITTT